VRKCNTIIAGRIPLSAVILTLLRSTHLLVYPYQVKDNLGTHMLQASTQPLILALGSGASATVYGLCLAGVEIMAQSELAVEVGVRAASKSMLRASWSMRFDSCIRVLSTHSRLVNSGQS